MDTMFKKKCALIYICRKTMLSAGNMVQIAPENEVAWNEGAFCRGGRDG